MSNRGVAGFAPQLASSEKDVRDRSLEDVHRWMSSSSFNDINENDMMKLWMGLYMSMWMVDKPLFQEKLAADLAGLVDCLSDSNEVFLFITAFFKVIRKHWSKIDRLRMDKFYMLIRTMLRRTLQYLQAQEWEECIIDQYLQLMPVALNTSQTSFVADGVTYHIIDVFLTELKKVSSNQLPDGMAVSLLRPFIDLLATTSDFSLRSAISDNVFKPLTVTTTMQKLSINAAAMATEFLNLAKDVNFPRATANRKCLYQLQEEFSKAKECAEGENSVIRAKPKVTSKKQKGNQVDVITEGKQNKRKKKHSTSSKDFVTDSSTSSSRAASVTADITDNNMSPCQSNIFTVVDGDNYKITEGIRKLRKRSLPSMCSTNMLLEQGDTKKKKKRRSFHSRLADIEAVPSPLRITTRSGKEYWKHLMKEPQLQLRPVATDELASTLSLSKRVKFALQKNESFDHGQRVQKKLDHLLTPSKSVLKPSKKTTTPSTLPSPPASTVTTRRKSSRFFKPRKLNI